MISHGRRASAFTLVELLIVVVVAAIAAAMLVPRLGSTTATQLIAAGRMLTADIEFAQNESIAHGDDPRLIKIDQAGNRYWIAAASDVNTPIPNPAYPDDSEGMRVTFGGGRAQALSAVTIQGYSLDGDDELRFDMYGTPDQTTSATLTLAADGATITITIAPISGEVTVQ